MSYEVRIGDCRDVLAGLGDASVDAVVCDPPYELGFMGKAWDRSGIAYDERVWLQALRVLKPGGHLLAFGGTRTYHRLAVAIEDAGFEIRDTLVWLFGQGFPKSLDVSKAIDERAGAEREELPYMGKSICPGLARGEACSCGSSTSQAGATVHTLGSLPATPEAQAWQGWGTGLKPAHEPIVMARKPLAGTVAANVLAHGTGAINVDGCRIEGRVKQTGSKRPSRKFGRTFNGGKERWDDSAMRFEPHEAGRWPANVLLDQAAADMLDAETRHLRAAGNKTTREQGTAAIQSGVTSLPYYWGPPTVVYEDSGGASRFFYVAKAARAEREAGLGARGVERVNSHPTVKPIGLMRWLVRLVTPTGGLVLDPFAGSGTTGCAAVMEGMRFLGVEQDEKYAEIASARIEHWARQQPQLKLEVA